MGLSEDQIREIIGRAVRDASFATALKNAADADEFVQELENRGWEVSTAQASEISSKLDDLQAAAETLDMSGIRFIS